MYEEHEMIRRAAVQAMNNLLFDEEVVKLYEGKNDRTKYLFLLCTYEDVELAKAAAGGLAVLTSVSKRASRKIFDVGEWKETICYLLCSSERDLQHRAAVIVNNIVRHSKELAQKLLEPEVIQVLEVLSKLGKNRGRKARQDNVGQVTVFVLYFRNAGNGQNPLSSPVYARNC